MLTQKTAQTKAIEDYLRAQNFRRGCQTEAAKKFRVTRQWVQFIYSRMTRRGETK